MSQARYYIAVDLGAESGRVMLGSVSSDQITLEQIHRFANGPVEQAGSLRWDFESLFNEIKSGIGEAIERASAPPAGIAVDSWGVDYGLIDKSGRLVENPYHYRDSRTDNMTDAAFALMPKNELYDNTGIQFMQLNTVFQLLAARRNTADQLAKAENLLLTADLVAYHLCGSRFAEYTLASTSQLMDMRSGEWSKAVFEKLHLPIDIMPDVVSPASVVGTLKADLAAEFNCDPIAVIAAASHDTAAAVAAVPATSENYAYISSGTWSLMGAEIPAPIINAKTLDYQFTNEGGVQNTIRLLKNIAGLWLVQECRRHWQQQGDDYSYAALAEMAQKAKPFTAYIDPDHASFLTPGDMPAKINDYLRQTNQPTIDDKGQLIRAILESLALKYRATLEQLHDIIAHDVDVIHIVGGGVQNELLCQLTADALGKSVMAGPVEATALGNITMQAIATGQIASLADARRLVAQSFQPKRYTPRDTDDWGRWVAEIDRLIH